MVISLLCFSHLRWAFFACLFVLLLPIDAAIAGTDDEIELVASPYLLAASTSLSRRATSPNSSQSPRVPKKKPQVQKTHKRVKKVTVTRKELSFVALPSAELQKNAAQCYRFPDAWAFVAGAGTTFADYKSLLARISGDSEDEVANTLRQVNPKKQFSNLNFFSYTRIPQKYKSAFRNRFNKQISQHNAIASCRDPVRPSRVYVVPSNMAVTKLLQSLGSKQQESKTILANQMAALNTNVRPGNQVQKGEIVLIPQSYPYSSLSVNSNKQINLAEISLETEQDAIENGGFLWSLGYLTHAAKVEGQDAVAGGSFTLVTDSANAIELSLGYDMDSSAGQLTLSTVVNQLNYTYKNTTETNITNTKVESSNYLLRGYWQTSGSVVGYGSEIGQSHLVDLERASQTQVAVTGGDVPFVAGFVQYAPSDKVFGLGYGGSARVNLVLSSGDYTGTAVVDFGGFVLWRVSAGYGVSFDLGYRKHSYEKTENKLLSATVYSGISIRAF